MTNRDRRRETRQQQYQRRQEERKAERLRQLRQQQIRRYGMIGGGILVLALIVLGISQLLRQNTGQQPNLNPQPATGQTVDGLQCLSQQGGALHHHQYLDIYINGTRMAVPAGVGLVSAQNCLYPLHVHDGEPNIIHNESGQANASYTLGQFFDIWGVALSKSQISSYKTDGSHQMAIKLIDSTGKVTTYTGDPHALPLADQETIYILYNSPNVKLTPYTNWATLTQ
ncbi:MAG TPA: hypothetical protein VF725_09330 [Ktedonobacterales bacterium]